MRAHALLLGTLRTESRTWPFSLAIVALLVLCCWPGRVVAQETRPGTSQPATRNTTQPATRPEDPNKVWLKLNLKADDSWSVSQTADTQITFTKELGGQTQEMRQETHTVLTLQTAVLEAENGLPRKIKTTFGNDCRTTVSLMGQTLPLSFPLAGKTLTLTRKSDGVDVEPRDAVDENGVRQLKSALEGSQAFYPARAVTPGDKWTVKPDALAMICQFTGDAKGDLECALKEVKMDQGRKIALVTLKGAVSGKNADVEIAVDSLTGTLVVDVATGLALESDIKADVTVGGAKGTSVVKTSQKLVAK